MSLPSAPQWSGLTCGKQGQSQPAQQRWVAVPKNPQSQAQRRASVVATDARFVSQIVGAGPVPSPGRRCQRQSRGRTEETVAWTPVPEWMLHLMECCWRSRMGSNHRGRRRAERRGGGRRREEGRSSLERGEEKEEEEEKKRGEDRRKKRIKKKKKKLNK